MGLSSILLYVMTEREAAAREHIISAMRDAGALSSSSARSLLELGVETNDTWQRLLAEGRIREGAPERFYSFEPSPERGRERLVKMVGFYLLLILIPGRSHADSSS